MRTFSLLLSRIFLILLLHWLFTEIKFALSSSMRVISLVVSNQVIFSYHLRADRAWNSLILVRSINMIGMSITVGVNDIFKKFMLQNPTFQGLWQKWLREISSPLYKEFKNRQEIILSVLFSWKEAYLKNHLVIFKLKN